MKLPRLKIRPLSQQSCARFGGVYHNPAAPIGTWYDERNLCSDLSPNAIARPARVNAQNIDGNTPTAPIVAMCGGDHPVLLDETGTFWCNGNSVQLEFYSQDDKGLRWYWTVDRSGAGGTVHVSVTPEEGFGGLDVFNGLGLDGETVAWESVWFRCVADEFPAPVWEYDKGLNGNVWFPCNLSDFNIEITGDNYLDNVKVRLDQYISYSGLLKPGHRLVRMGARVIDTDTGIWVNAVQLASGAEMQPGEDYGDSTVYLSHLSVMSNLDMVLCDIDGNPYNGVVVQDYQPVYQEGYWLDTSQAEPVLREWNYLSSAWIKVSSTYVKVGPLMQEDSSGNQMPVKAGDVLKFTTQDGETTEAADLLNNKVHYIYKVIWEAGDEIYLVISGIMDADSVTDSTVFVKGIKSWPKLDYVVEAQNRLWGCRYSEEDGLNEIYASALGDFTNWQVFQGLSTDSWTASRGTAAPFTGAAVLDGHPLFFREESLEKVYPSASGAHQIQTFDLEGVEEGAANSLCVIEDRLYYKSPKGIMVYTGSLPRRISDALGDLEFTGGSGARHLRKYCLSTKLKGGNGDEAVVLVYDLSTGDWHIETDAWTGKAVTWKDELYYIEAGELSAMGSKPGGRVMWWAETAPQAIHDESAARSLTAHKWISYFRLRFRFLNNGTARMPSTLNIYFSYEDGPWELKKSYTHSGADGQMKTYEINFLPKRKDNFRLRLEGQGPVQIYDVAWRMEKSEGGH